MLIKCSIYTIVFAGFTFLFGGCSEQQDTNTDAAADKAADKYADAADKVCACEEHLSAIKKMKEDMEMLEDASMMEPLLAKQDEFEECLAAAYGADKDSIIIRVEKRCPVLATY